MRFISIYTPISNTAPPTPERMASMGALTEKMTRSGHLVATGGMMSSAATGLRIALHEGQFEVTTGPFSDAFSKTSGFAILQAATKEELVTLMRDFLEIAGDGESIALQLMEGPPPRA